MFDVSYIGAFTAGLLSFLSPCILPIVPFYLSYLAGTSLNQLDAETGINPDVRRRALLSAILFSLGIISVFVGLGATATLFGQMVREYFGILRWVAAAIIILMGLHFLGILRIGLLNRHIRADTGRSTSVSFFGAYVIGLAFAFGWTPCVGPVLAAILFTASSEETAASGAQLLFVYGAAMTAPFILAALFIGPFLRALAAIRRYLGTVEKAMGAMLVGFAVLIGTDSMNLIADLMLTYGPDIGVLR